MSTKSKYEVWAFVFGLAIRGAVFLWLLQYPWGLQFVVGMLFFDVSHLRYREFVK